MDKNMNRESLVSQKENVYFAISVFISIIMYMVLFFSVIGIIILVVFFALSIILHALMMGYIRGNAVKLSEEQFPNVYLQTKELSEKMGLEKVPDIYVLESGGILNAFATRFFGRNMVVIFSDIFDLAAEKGEDELAFIIAHELAHIKRRHVLLHILLLPAKWIPFLGEAYMRACEYTCDRYAVYYVNNFEAAKNALTILAIGKRLYKDVNHRAYLKQIEDEKSIFVWLSEKLSTHPRLPKRIQEVARFMEQEDWPYFKQSKKRVMIGIALLFGLMVVLTACAVYAFQSFEKTNLWAEIELGVEGTTPLMQAAYNDDVEQINKLISEGADLEAKDIEGSTALDWAVYGYSYEAAEALLEAGANPNTKDEYGSTPLINAVFNEDAEMVGLLMKYGANPYTQDNDGLSAIDHAKKLKDKAIIDILQP
jgi:Zn-dependent protease with chaperone function